MKKTSIILLVLAMLLAITAVVSAESKSDYYAQMANAIARINAGLDEGSTYKAQVAMGELRSAVYQCARYLVTINAYDARILNVVDLAGQAFTQPDYRKYLGFADKLAAEILLDRNNGDFGFPSIETSHS